MRIIKLLMDLNEDTYKLLKESSLTMDMDFMVKATSKDRELALAILTLIDCLKSSKSFVEYQEGIRLLDANELRNQFSSDEIYGPEEIKCIIDNAPTVEAYTLEDMQNNYDAGVDSIIGKYDKAEGEWNYIQAGMCVCPFCGAMPHKLYKNFCAKCGAKLKGGLE